MEIPVDKLSHFQIMRWREEKNPSEGYLFLLSQGLVLVEIRATRRRKSCIPIDQRALMGRLCSFHSNPRLKVKEIFPTSEAAGTFEGKMVLNANRGSFARIYILFSCFYNNLMDDEIETMFFASKYRTSHVVSFLLDFLANHQ